MTITLKPLLFDEAIRFFEEKGLRLSPESYRDVWAAEHVSAFTVARVTAVDILEDIRKAVTDAIQDGIPLNEFKAALSSILEAKGWFTPKGEEAEITLPDGTVRKRLTPWRLNTIYQTNLQSAYSTGRYSQMMGVAAERPYWMYDAVNDSRTRPSHAARDGMVYRFDHPFWNTWYPPNGYNCFPPWIKVLTSIGWKPIATVMVKDRVVGGSGNEQGVTAVHRNRFDGELVRLVFENGVIDATPNHRILTMCGWVRADGLKPGDILVQTSELLPSDPLVRDVDDSDSQSRNRAMTLPVERKSAGMLAFDPEIQRWDEDIHPPRANCRRDNMIVEDLKAEPLEMVDHSGLCACGRSPGGAMRRWVSLDIQNVGRRTLLSHFFSSCRSILLKFFGSLKRACMVFFGAAKAWVPTFSNKTSGCGLHCLSGLDMPLLGSMNPLRPDGFAASSRFNSVMSKQAHQSPRIDAPSSAELPVREHIDEIPILNRSDDGAPLNRFDSLDDFAGWARSHCILQKVGFVKKLAYNGTVFNLSVENDVTYIVQGAVVHNCRCVVRTLSPVQMQRRGLSERIEGVAETPDEGFAYNPGQEKWQPDFNKYSAEASAIIRRVMEQAGKLKS